MTTPRYTITLALTEAEYLLIKYLQKEGITQIDVLRRGLEFYAQKEQKELK